MKILDVIQKYRKQTIAFIFKHTVYFGIFSLCIGYSIFLLIPDWLIQFNIISYSSITLIIVISFLFPLCSLVYHYPVLGNSFLKKTLTSPFSIGDIRSAIEIELGKAYPVSFQQQSISFELSSAFSDKVARSICLELNKKRSFFTKKLLLWVFIGIVTLCGILSYFRSHFLMDMWTALTMGIPLQFISIGPPLEFEKFEAHILPPAYLNQDQITRIDLKQTLKIEVLQGSKLVLKGTLSDCQSGQLMIFTPKGLEYFPVTLPEKNQFEVSFIVSIESVFALSFKRAILGKHNEKSRIYKISVLTDQPPSIQIHAPEKYHTITYGQPFEIIMSASDDYGILEITLYHRAAGTTTEYHRQLIARFPREAPKDYNTSYWWNPIFIEGETYNQLAYDIGTENIEYYIEVRDINLFSPQSTTKSDLHYIRFENVLAGYIQLRQIILDLIKEGKAIDLKRQPGVTNYQNQLAKALTLFTTTFKDVLPSSRLIEETQKMLHLLSLGMNLNIQDMLNEYIHFLERYLLLLEMVKQVEGMDFASKEMAKISSELNKGDIRQAFKKMLSLTEWFEQEFTNELKEIQDLLEKGDMELAKKKLEELLDKMRESLSERFKAAQSMFRQLMEKLLKQLQGLTEKAMACHKQQSANLPVTESEEWDTAKTSQKSINNNIYDLKTETDELKEQYPVVFDMTSENARSAHLFGMEALANLQQKLLSQSLKSENNVLTYLEKFMNQLSQQTQKIKQYSKGNFQDLMSSMSQTSFVYIPKDALYPVPVEYKDKIIELSKKRNKIDQNTLLFWRDVLQ
ncbi:MAG: hypothetical protein HQK77_00800 [Desulfobacterales bacterium]|nr:hypothetical protein [Desulfobacterales bacterium]